MKYSNSKLVDYIKISPNKTSPRNHKIDTITIHCMAGNLSIETCANVFAPKSAQVSSNYGVGSDGRIGMYVEEKDRSWCSSNRDNDNRAITIEVANDGGAPEWHVTDKAMNTLIKLIADICKRNDIKELKWKADKSLIGQVDKQNMTVHCWFQNKSCPGEYLYNNHFYIAEKVNALLGKKNNNNTSNISNHELFRIRKSWNDSSSQIGAYSSLDNAISACKIGYSVFDNTGKKVYTNEKNNSTISKYTHKNFVKDIQKALGITVDGIAENRTLVKTVTISKSKNNKHPVVKPIQKYLNSIGYNCGNPDGIAGNKFDSAIKIYQNNNGCIADGEITSKMKTWKKLLKIS